MAGVLCGLEQELAVGFYEVGNEFSITIKCCSRKALLSGVTFYVQFIQQ